MCLSLCWCTRLCVWISVCVRACVWARSCTGACNTYLFGASSEGTARKIKNHEVKTGLDASFLSVCVSVNGAYLRKMRLGDAQPSFIRLYSISFTKHIDVIKICQTSDIYARTHTKHNTHTHTRARANARTHTHVHAHTRTHTHTQAYKHKTTAAATTITTPT